MFLLREFAMRVLKTILCIRLLASPAWTCQPRLIAAKRIRLFRITVGSQATTQEQFFNAFRQRRGQSRNFLIVWRQQYLKLRTSVLAGAWRPRRE